MAKKETSIKLARPISELLKGRRLGEGHPLFDEKARADLDRRVEHIGRQRRSGDVAYWKEGWDFIVIRDHKLFRQDGYNGMRPWLRGKLKRGTGAVADRIRFAERFSLEEVVTHTRERLELGDDYARLTLSPDAAWSPATFLVDVPEDGKLVSRPFRDLESPDLERAVAHQEALADRRREASLVNDNHPLLGRMNDALTVPELGSRLAKVDAAKARSGLPDDTLVTVTVRYGDLESALVKLAAAVSDGARKPRPRTR